MKIWLVSRDGGGWDTYDSMVVIAETEEQAKLMYPGGAKYKRVDNGSFKGWFLDGNVRSGPADGWDEPENLSVELVGTAEEGAEPEVVLASYNAG